MHKVFYLLLFLLCSINGRSQEAITELKQGLVSEEILSHIDLNHTNILVLGEDQHFGEVENKLNADLIEVLVRDYQFTDLIIESDFFALHQITTKKEGDERDNIFDAWKDVVAFEKVFSLVQKDSLSVYGFDSNHHGVYSKQKVLDFILENVEEPKQENLTFFKEKAQSLLTLWINDTICERNKQNFVELLDLWISQSEKGSFIYQELVNFKGYAQQTWADKTGGWRELVRLRDENMVKNVDYLLKHELKGRKVILLGAKIHVEPGITKYSKHVDKNIGDFLMENYVILTLLPYVYEGQRGTKYPEINRKVSNKGKKTLAHQLAKSEVDYALIDVQKLSKDEIVYVKKEDSSRYGYYLLFIRETHPAERYK